MRRRLGSWLVLAVLAAGCATPHASHQPTVNNQTDVWFAQHMVPHLLQDSSIAYLTRARLTDPELARVANRIHRRSQTQATQLLEWLAERGLAPHGHSHQPGDRLRRSDLEQLSQLGGAALDLAFVKVITARDRAGTKLAATEARGGSVPAIRQLAQQLLAEQQARIAMLRSWRRAGRSRTPAGHRLRSPVIRRWSACRHVVVTSRGLGQEQRRNNQRTLDKASGFPILV
ncbi:MAG: hypothetical protein K0S88_5894 [Actinomycetia bacterium]|nr:hypothetical protein [Actinomycetes bacterium]